MTESLNRSFSVLIAKIVVAIILAVTFSLASYAGWKYAFEQADGHCIGPICVTDDTCTVIEEGIKP